MRTDTHTEPSTHGLGGHQASEFLSALLCIAAHDLRRPLQIIQSTHEWLGSRTSADCERSRVTRGERAINELTDQLDTLVSALRLYEYTRGMEIGEVSLSGLLSRLARDNAEAAASKDVKLRIYPSSYRVVSNPVLLGGIFRNLLTNAVKYTHSGGRILVGCRKVDGEVRIDVYDTGAGMAPEKLPNIFEAFQRLDSNNEDGLGLGLFAVRRAIGLLGHRIEVKSMPGRGSRFSVYARTASAH